MMTPMLSPALLVTSDALGQSHGLAPKAASFPPRSGVRPDYQRLARELRDDIIGGKFTPGTRLPSTEQLAARWRSSTYTVHTALAALAREGWIERIHGAGTYVAEPRTRFTTAGIYHESDLASVGRADFARILNESLCRRLGVLGKASEVFVDTRPAGQRDKLLPALSEALLDRSIQCVIAPTATFGNSPALARLGVPTAYAGNPGSLNRVDFDKSSFLREGLRALVAQGCRSIGLLSAYPKEPRHEGEQVLLPALRQAAREEGVTTRNEWVSDVRPEGMGLEEWGYREFARIWKLRHRPEGLLVFPDDLARGMIACALRVGFDEVNPAMKFVIHRNAEAHLLCPFPVTWGISNVDFLARQLIQVIEKQFRGEKVAPLLLDYDMQFDDGAKWR